MLTPFYIVSVLHSQSQASHQEGMTFEHSNYKSGAVFTKPPNNVTESVMAAAQRMEVPSNLALELVGDDSPPPDGGIRLDILRGLFFTMNCFTRGVVTVSPSTFTILPCLPQGLKVFGDAGHSFKALA